MAAPKRKNTALGTSNRGMRAPTSESMVSPRTTGVPVK